MIAFPNCKINIGLNIIRKREDGFHDLETVFYPIPFTDVLEILPSEKPEFIITGLQVDTTDNLCIKAYNLLKQDFADLPSLKMHLHKAIPLGAGLGGGSSDAAFTLRLLNEKFNLGLSAEQLLNYALQLGSDVPFFMVNEPCFATGRGEILQPIKVDLTNYKLILVNPGIHISTEWAFSNITPQKPGIPVTQIISQPIETWKDLLQNDFEVPVFAECPEIENIKKDMYKKGALYASMSGTGSSVYGIFRKGTTPDIQPQEKYFYKVIDSLDKK